MQQLVFTHRPPEYTSKQLRSESVKIQLAYVTSENNRHSPSVTCSDQHVVKECGLRTMLSCAYQRMMQLQIQLADDSLSRNTQVYRYDHHCQ